MEVANLKKIGRPKVCRKKNRPISIVKSEEIKTAIKLTTEYTSVCP